MNKLIFTTLVFAAVASANNAGLTCDAWAIVPNTADITANCRDPRGTVHGARISTSTCVANDDGNPSCRAKNTFCFSSVGAPLTSITYVAAVLGVAGVSSRAEALRSSGESEIQAYERLKLRPMADDSSHLAVLRTRALKLLRFRSIQIRTNTVTAHRIDQTSIACARQSRR
ncbi:hypothetical protein B0H10DRAFT_2202202 [Mycena sp. CBHHK59/15]|nr:hypothetical protein B0H10DRAFT_2202202 [Mycena sp. CBHHK59/15]